MIIARISARPDLLKIKETIKLAPVGQTVSKLHKELNRSSATLVSLTKLKVHAVQRLVRHTLLHSRGQSY